MAHTSAWLFQNIRTYFEESLSTRVRRFQIILDDLYSEEKMLFCQNECLKICVPWLIHMCAMTHSYVCHDSFISVPWLIHICAMTRMFKVLSELLCAILSAIGVLNRSEPLIFSTNEIFVCQNVQSSFQNTLCHPICDWRILKRGGPLIFWKTTFKQNKASLWIEKSKKQKDFYFWFFLQ